MRIYLDNAATTPARPEVVEAMMPHFTGNGYNPSSLHAEGRAARQALDEARDRVAAMLGASRKEVVFTAGGSEADTLALVGVANALKARGRHLVSSTIEHHAVLHALDALGDDGWEVTLLPVTPEGVVDPDAFAAALRPDTVLASVMYANNEIGTLQPVRELAAIAREAGVLFHTDAVQVPAYVSVDVSDLGVDLLSISAHKFYGPKGVGALYVREGTPIHPTVYGGSQEFSKRAGTENVAGIVGMARALELATGERGTVSARIASLRDRLENGILECIPDVRINGGDAPRLPNNCSVSFAGVQSEHVLVRLDLEGIAVSAGSACTSGALEPSHVISALGLPEEWMQGVIRFSLGRGTTAEQIERVLEVLGNGIAELREFSPVPA
ncbi:MAG: cysteine desulfurase family protein [Vulcanimicrobiaceae bacterium]